MKSFKKGERVRLTEEAKVRGIKPKNSTGIVSANQRGTNVHIIVDGNKYGDYYSDCFWERIL